MIVAAILVFLPAFLMFYYILKPYTYPAVEEPFFKDSTAFTLLFVGLIEGFFISAAYVGFNLMPNIILAIAFAFVQQLAILVVLNLKRFHSKSDTVFYGFSLGLGQGVGMGFGVTIYQISSVGNIENLDLLSWFLIISFITHQLLTTCSAGANIGEGIARLRILEFTSQAALASVLGMILWALSWSTAIDNSPIWFIFPTIMMVVSGYYFYKIIYLRLHLVVDDVLKLEGKKRKDIPR